MTTSQTLAYQQPTTWQKSDTVWMLGLYGTAIGAGVLFLPITAGIGGLIPLLVMAVLALPMTYFSHLGLCRFVLSGKRQGEDITEVVEEHFGFRAGQLITLLYFFAIYPILLVYSVAITNTAQSFIVNQLHLAAPPRALLSLILIGGLILIARLGGSVIVKVMSLLVFPFITVLTLLALSLIPHWSLAILQTAHLPSQASEWKGFWMTLWLAIPVMVFSFNHSPIISSFAVAKRQEYGHLAEGKCAKILRLAHIMMVITVMFFVFSCVLSLSSADLQQAKEQNITILSYLANHFHTPMIAYFAPIIAFVAISKSFLGHYLGASEGLHGIACKWLRQHNKPIVESRLHRFCIAFMLATSWIVATLNPSILNMIETLGGPVIAVLLFLMPMYAIRRVPALQKYQGQKSNLFVVVIGLIAISAIVYGLAN